MTWFYCSFADADTFLGAAIVQASSIEYAAIETHRLGINPGGECVGYPLFMADVPDEKWCNRLLTRDELNEIWPGQMVRYGDVREQLDAQAEAYEKILLAKSAKMWN